LTELYLYNNQLTSFNGSGLTSLTNLDLSTNQLTTMDISNIAFLQYLLVNDNFLTPSVNNSLLAKLAANELSNDWDSGQFSTSGGRTSAGTNDYDYLINEGWTIDGADLGGYNSNKFDWPLLAEEFLRAGLDFDIQGKKLVDVQ
jgi:hypothetical protein